MRARALVSVAGARARRLMGYRGDFWLGTVATLLVQAGLAWTLWSSLFREAGAVVVAGYSLRDMFVYLLLVSVVGRVVRGMGRAEGSLATDVYDGSLLRYGVLPMAYLPMKYAERVGETLPGLVQVALLLGGVALLLQVPPGDVGALAQAAVSMALANALYFALMAPVEGVALWAESVWSLLFMARYVVALLGGALMPLALFPEGAQAALYWSPFPYLFDRPVNTMLGRIATGEWLTGCAIAAAWIVALGLLSGRVWAAGRGRYAGPGA